MRAIRRRIQLGEERGETLTELLVAIAILSIGIIALVGGLLVAITGSHEHRGRASADTLARSTAECIKDRGLAYAADGNYAACTTAQAAISDKKWWDGTIDSNNTPNWAGSQNSNGLQQLTVTATVDGTSESVTILKRQN